MELPFEKTVCRFWKQKLYTMRALEQTQEVKLPDSMPDVGKIISSWAQVILRSKDWRGSGVGLSGGVMVWVLYAPEGEGPLQKIESWIPWKCHVDFPDKSDTPDGIIRVETMVTGVDARSLSSRKLMLRSTLGLLVEAQVPDSVELYSPGELPEDVQMLSKNYPLRLTRELGEKSFRMEERLELPGGLPKVSSVVYYRMEPEVVDQKVMGAKAVFRGVGNLHLLYFDPDNRLCTADFEVPFAQYVELEGQYEDDARTQCLMAITSLELEADDEGLELKCGLIGQYMVTAEAVVALMEDAYSPSRSVELQRASVELPAWLDQRQEAVDFSQTVTAEDGMMVDQIFLPSPPTVSRRSDNATVELEGTFQAVLQKPDGTCTGKTLHETQTCPVSTGCDTICYVRPKGKTNIRKEGIQWRMDTQVLLSIYSLCSQPMEMVTGMELGPLQPQDPERPSVIIRAKGKGNTLWDIAKENGSTVSSIQRLNHLEQEPEDDRLLLIPIS